MGKFGEFMSKVGAGLALMAEEAEKKNIIVQRQQCIKNGSFRVYDDKAYRMVSAVRVQRCCQG